MIRIKIDRKKCIGCLTCTTACKVSHGGRDTRGYVVFNSDEKYTPIYCRHCTRPECVYACPTGAMQKIMKLVMHYMIRVDVQVVLCA